MTHDPQTSLLRRRLPVRAIPSSFSVAPIAIGLVAGLLAAALPASAQSLGANCREIESWVHC
jgi:hypothetical protein